MVFGVVYKYEWPDGMKYIGQRSAGPLEGYPTHSDVVRARIKEEGFDNIKVTVLCKCGCQQSLDCTERVYQIANDVVNDPMFYNKRIHMQGFRCTGHTEKTKKKIIKSLIGRPCSEETRKKLSEANKDNKPWITGKYHSEETKKKISNAQKGKVFSEEHKNNLRCALKGRVFSEEHKKKIAKTCTGRKHSKKTKEKISRARRLNRLVKKGLFTRC